MKVMKKQNKNKLTYNEIQRLRFQYFIEKAKEIPFKKGDIVRFYNKETKLLLVGIKINY
ncbi:MAG: hypothetical protein KatS3mg096_788 [Candidatus Parcubacteria bacterium]|nr:MAG: hypothetical protein KatS3mg096_788 [Candidatus Parcubacteria bacterium]